MSIRKYPSGYEILLKKKRQKEELIESQKWAMDKFITSKKKNLAENLSEDFINEQEIHQKELEDNENIQQNDNNEGGHDNVQSCNVTILDNEAQNNLEEGENKERLSGFAILSIENEILAELKWKNLISNFASQKARKINFNWKNIWIYN